MRIRHSIPRTVLLAGLMLAGGLGLGGPVYAFGGDPAPARSAVDADYEAGRKAVDAKDWKTAIAALTRAAERNGKNADIQNYLGYAYRNEGNMDLAMRHYAEALRIDPKHRGAREYLGEAYLMANDLGMAEAQLSELDKLCTFGCVEYTELKTKIAAFKSKPRTS